MWVRGLKLSSRNTTFKRRIVASYVDAWIETLIRKVGDLHMLSHPMWVRGLKLICPSDTLSFGVSHPMWVRGLKHIVYLIDFGVGLSHPMWVRGLKRI